MLGPVFAVAMIAISIFFDNPRMLLDREPGWFDWLEDLVYTGMLSVAAGQLSYAAFT